MRERFSPDMLRHLRNDIPIARLIGDVLGIPSKISEGYFRFLCPLCSDFNTATNPKTNLARCFRCERNFNPIDIVMLDKRMTFVEAVGYLRGIVTLNRTNCSMDSSKAKPAHPCNDKDPPRERKQ